MANAKISALTSATTPLAGTEVLPVVQSSATTQVTVANLTAGRAVSGLSFSAATFGAPASTTLNLQANATTYATILGAGTNNGFFGIGTASPQTKLQVDATASLATVFNIRLNNTSGPAGSGVGIEAYTAGINSIGNLQFIRTGSAYAQSAFTVSTADAAGGGVLERIRVDSSGNFNIVAGNVSIATSGKGITTGSAIPLGFGTNGGTAAMTLDTSGNLSATGRFTPRVLASTANSATPTLNTDSYDMMVITGQTLAITSFTTNLTGTPVNGQKLLISITGTAAVGITWGASFEASTTALPTTTVTTNRLDVGFIWNVATTKWRCLAVA